MTGREPSRGRPLHSVGGSDAQDDLFRQTYPTALLGAGRTADAMTSFRTLSPLDEQLRAGI